MFKAFVIAGYQYHNWWTHNVRSIHKNVFIMAAKSDESYG